MNSLIKGFIPDSHLHHRQQRPRLRRVRVVLPGGADLALRRERLEIDVLGESAPIVVERDGARERELTPGARIAVRRSDAPGLLVRSEEQRLNSSHVRISYAV